MKNIVLIGLTGCGKSTIGKVLSQKLSLDFVDMDEYIERKEGKTINEIFRDAGESYFRAQETLASLELSKTGDKIIATGGGVILNPENMKYLKQKGIVVFLDRSPDEILKKIRLSTRPMLAQNKNRLYELDRERRHLYESYADLTIISRNINASQTAEKVIGAIRSLL